MNEPITSQNKECTCSWCSKIKQLEKELQETKLLLEKARELNQFLDKRITTRLDHDALLHENAKLSAELKFTRGGYVAGDPVKIFVCQGACKPRIIVVPEGTDERSAIQYLRQVAGWSGSIEVYSGKMGSKQDYLHIADFIY